MRVRGDLIISGTSVTGGCRTAASQRRTAAVWLPDARIEGRLLVVGTRFETTAHRAIHADGMSVGGAVRFIEGSSTNAEIRLLRARIGGPVDLSGARLEPHDGRALDLREARFGSLFLIPDLVTKDPVVVRGRINLEHAHIDGRFLIRAAKLYAPPWGVGLEPYDAVRPGQVPAVIEGPSMVIAGDLTIEPDVVVRGGIVLPGSKIGGVRAVGAGLHNPGSMALNLWRAEIASGVDLTRAVIQGMVNLTEAHITGSVSFAGAFLTRPWARRCVRAIGVTITGVLSLNRATAVGGGLRFRSASIGSAVDAEGAKLFNPGDVTLNLHQAQVGGNVRLHNGFVSVGVVVLNRCVVAGRLRCEGGTYTWLPHGHQPDAEEVVEGAEPNDRGSAVEAISAVFGGGMGLGWSVPLGAVDFTDTRTSYLADDPATDWPHEAYLTGFTYERYAPLDMTTGDGVWAAQARIDWLTRVSPRDRRPWEQASRVLRSNGDAYGADAVLAAYRRLARRRLPAAQWPRKLADWLWDAAVMYGYRPQRALGILLALVVAMWGVLLPAGVHDHLRASDPVGAVYSPSGPVAVGDIQGPAGDGCGAGRVRCFDPLYYAIDTVVPIIDLHQRSDWHAAPDVGGRRLDLLLSLATILGWLFSTVFAVALTRLGGSH